MSFIDNTYFINDINIAGNILSTDNFVPTIDRYEPEILEDLLGYELYKALLSDLDTNGDPQTQRFIDLVNGVEFSFELGSYTINTKWEGLINTDKVSLISYYVYYNYRKDNDSFYSGAGTQVESNTENSVKSENWAVLSSTWNKMVKLYGIGLHYYTNYRDNTTYDFENDYPSAYNFLLANLDDYPEWIFKPKLRINQFGI